jgi:hypothetical protein
MQAAEKAASPDRPKRRRFIINVSCVVPERAARRCGHLAEMIAKPVPKGTDSVQTLRSRPIEGLETAADVFGSRLEAGLLPE